MEGSNVASNKKKFYVGMAVAIILILGGAFAVYFFNKDAKTSTKKNMAANLSLVSGQVMVKDGDQGRYQEAKEGDNVYTGNYIKTGNDSKTVVVFDTGDVVRVNANTEIKLASISSTEVSAEVLAGDLYSRVEKSDGKKFIVKSYDTQALAMGTAFNTKCNKDDKKVEYQVIESKVKVNDKDEVDAGKKAIVNTENKEVKVEDLSDDDYNNQFVAWNKDEDVKAKKEVTAYKQWEEKKAKAKADEEKRKQEEAQRQEQERKQAEETARNNYFTLTASATESGVNLSWKISGYNVPNGFKLVKGPVGTTPVYPGSDYVYLSDSSTRSYTWKITTGETYNFRVCTYNGSGCNNYSNLVQVKTQERQQEQNKGEDNNSVVNSLSLSGQATQAGKIKLTWTVDGHSSMGYKVVWSENSGPTYPCRDGDSYHYISNPEIKYDAIEGLESGKTYRVRVCEYLGGKCGKYSNEVTIVTN